MRQPASESVSGPRAASLSWSSMGARFRTSTEVSTKKSINTLILFLYSDENSSVLKGSGPETLFNLFGSVHRLGLGLLSYITTQKALKIGYL